MEQSRIINIVKKTTPAVVSIAISKDLPKLQGFYSIPFGGRQFIIPRVSPKETERIKIGGGSGFFVSPDGIILTNSHVVADPEASYTVFLDHDKETKRELKILARDPIHDVAIGKIENAPKKGFAYLKLGDSAKLQLGQTAIAVGNALGEFSNSVSLGIVSGLSRFITAQTGMQRHAERLRGLIQTDAAINPGNSGGPLVDIEGKVIGINTAVVHGAENIGFALPINNAKKDLEEVEKYGHIRIPFLGVRYILLNKKIQEQNNLPVDHGALIIRETLGENAVMPGSSAYKAGLREFDIILEANGKKITPSNTLQDEIAEHKIGDELKLKVLRGKKEAKFTVKLEEKKK